MRKWWINKGTGCFARRGTGLPMLLMACVLFSGCGGKAGEQIDTVGTERAGIPNTGTEEKTASESEGGTEQAAKDLNKAGETSKNAEKELKEEGAGIAHETAIDGEVDFTELKKENPDIFAWIYIPDTDIDFPVLQSTEADDFYESHNAYGESSSQGALYTELANMRDMCDFNTVIHGKTSDGATGGLFDDLHRFADRDFFEKHESIYLYTEDNVLTYTVFAAYERENTSLIRTYDFTYGTGCEQFLKDMYGIREMGKNLREGWEEVTPYHFLITLTTQSQSNPEKQFVVIAALTSDAAGKINRQVEW